jgi:uncharacterized protein
VIGTGIAGLGAAYALARQHEVVLFERNDYVGGHTNTVAVRRDHRALALDTGFIVHNEQNYPNLVRLFRELGVRTQDSDMSFSVSCRRCGLEYSGRRPFAQPWNAANPRFRQLLIEIVRFLRSAPAILDDPRSKSATLGRCVAAEGYSRSFVDHYLVPLTAAIWSTAPVRALDFPAAYAVRFFDNHGMLGFRRHRWRSVVGGSSEYVRAILGRLDATVRTCTEVVALARDSTGVALQTADGERHRFDRAVVATHADEALRLLADPTEDEQRILGAFGYTRNETVLHTDERFLPAARAARASWNFQLEDCRDHAPKPTMTYYLNRLQQLDEAEHFCVTLNRSHEIRQDRVIERLVYHHPLYDTAALAAQKLLPSLNDPRHTVYCGAYHGFGFHEDGLVSGLRAAAALGARW